jgi:hypothetical protein
MGFRPLAPLAVICDRHFILRLCICFRPLERWKLSPGAILVNKNLRPLCTKTFARAPKERELFLTFSQGQVK